MEYLTAGAVEKLANGDVTTHIQMMPVLYVKKVMSSTIAEGTKEQDHFMLWLTDRLPQGQGQEIQGLTLWDDPKRLVRDKHVGPGTVIQLLQFTTRGGYVIIMDMKVIISSYDITGPPQGMELTIEQPQGMELTFEQSQTVEITPECVPESPGSDIVKPLVRQELENFSSRIIFARDFARDTRISKDSIRSTIRCFDAIITDFNKLILDLWGTPICPTAEVTSDSENLSKDQLRYNASSLIQFFTEKTFPPFLGLFDYTTNRPQLKRIQRLVEESSMLVYRCTLEGFDCKPEDGDKYFQWIP